METILYVLLFTWVVGFAIAGAAIFVGAYAPVVKFYWSLSDAQFVERGETLYFCPAMPMVRRVLWVTKCVCREEGWFGW